MKMSLLIIFFCLAVVLIVGFTMNQKIYAADIKQEKKAILVVSFGTTYADTRKLTTEAVQNKISAVFPDYEVRHAFTSRIIIKKLAECDGIKVDTEKQALDKLKAEGYKEIIIQPLHIEPGDEYEKLMRVVDNYEKSKAFNKIAVGRPFLYYTGQEGKPDDYLAAIKALQMQFPKLGNHEAIALMGHGGVNPANTAYAALQLKLEDAGLKKVYIFTVDGYPTFYNLKNKLKENKIKKVVLMPLMLVAGNHANEDLAGDNKDSFKSQLIQAGYTVEIYLHGLGENSKVQDIYVEHINDAMEGKYTKTERGKDRPPIPIID
ncbi:MAG: Sirohydrochlorin cobaltochelatase [Firmicutes bacterium]|nr:Sirohydrochlorin cobaltochelatase [Bacillota bacterium]